MQVVDFFGLHPRSSGVHMLLPLCHYGHTGEEVSQSLLCVMGRNAGVQFREQSQQSFQFRNVRFQER